MDIFLAKKGDALDIANIHKKELAEGFLASLPLEFLSKFYEALILCNESFCIIARENGSVVGFISGVCNMKSFYSYFFKNYFFISLFLLSSKVFSISFLKKVFENLFYPQKINALPNAELLTIAMKKEFQGQGSGGKLLEGLKQEFKKRNIQIFKVLVGKDLPALHFYEKHNFSKVQEVNLHSKEVSVVFIYNIQ